MAKKARKAPWLKLLLTLWTQLYISRAHNLLELFIAAARVGDITRSPGRKPNYFINDPEAIFQIMVKNEPNYTKLGSSYKSLEYLVGPGLLSSSGELWKQSREQTHREFHHEPITRTFPKVIEMTERALNDWSTRLGQTIDLVPEMSKLLLEVSSMTLFGSEIHDYSAKTVNEIRFANRYLVHSTFGNWKLPTKDNRRFRRARDFINSWVNKMLSPPHPSKDNYSPVLKCLWHQENDSPEEKERHLCEAKNFLIAGHETTGVTMTWLLYLLSKHPEILNDLTQEIDEVLKGKIPTFEQLDELPLTTMVIHEALRLYPPVWLIDRRVIEEDIVGGYRVPANSSIFIVPYVLHRHPEYWPDPETFDPQRFNKKNSQRYNKRAYIPFGAGPRVCIGKYFAMIMMKTILSMILQRFELAIDPSLKRGIEPLITLKPDGPIPFELKARKLV